MLLSPIVNTEVKMPQAMFDALSLHETFCVVSKIHATTEDQVRHYLAVKYGADFAKGFHPHYLLNSRGF